MHVCVKCKKLIKPASLAVFCAEEPHHPQCLACLICDRPLFGKGFKKNKNGTLQCETPCQKQQPQAQYNIESYKKVNNSSQPDQNQQKTVRFDDLSNQMQATHIDPYLASKQCKLCSQSVFGKRFVTYENADVICYDCDVRSTVRPARIKSAHIIICSFCNNTIHGKRYITEPNGKILCDKCEVNAPKCQKCARPIALDASFKSISNNIKFHAECFTCSSCNLLIRDEEFYENKTNEPLCLNCFEINKLPKCLECRQPISSGYIMVDNQPIHKECFKCSQCKELVSLDGGYFKNPLNNLPVCSKCHLVNKAPKCAKCMRIIEKDGCTYGDKDYHQVCFTCVECQVELMKMKKTYRGKADDEIMCEPCFTEKYAPKCGKCSQSISPHIPGTKYEDKMYHLECLACGRCKKTLANKKFFKVGNIQICEACY
jgi:LIM domain-containing protein 2